MGQYLRPAAWNLPVVSYATPGRFESLRAAGEEFQVAGAGRAPQGLILQGAQQRGSGRLRAARVHQQAVVPLLDPLGRSPGLDRPRVPAEGFLQRAGQWLGADLERLRGPGQDRDVSVQRYLIAALAVERWRLRTKALADARARRADVVTRWCRLGAELRQHDELFRRRYEDLDRALIGDPAADR